MHRGGPIRPADTVVLPETVAWTVTRLRIARSVLRTAEPCREDAAMEWIVAKLDGMIERLERQLDDNLEG